MNISGTIASQGGGSTPHVVFQVGQGSWYHGVGANGVRMIGAGSEWTSGVGYWNTLTIPLRNPTAAAGYIETSTAYGVTFRNCITTAVNVWWRGF
jgi:hypothetical protein